MTKLLLIHLPDLPWKCLASDNAMEKLPQLHQLLERGVSGVFPSIGPSPILDGVLATGQCPTANGLLTNKTLRPDGYGSDIAAVDSFCVPSLWSLFDRQDIKCSVVNQKATQFSSLSKGIVVSERYCEVLTTDAECWGIPPGSVSPMSIAEELSSLRFHASEITGEHLTPLIQTEQSQCNDANKKQFIMRIAAKVLSENTTVHSVATHLLANQSPDVLSVRYHALQQLNDHFAKPLVTNCKTNSAWQFMSLIDAFIARLMEMSSNDVTVFVTGGRDEAPFWIAYGPNIKQDLLFSEAVTLYDFSVTALAILGIESGDLPGKIAQEIFTENLVVNTDNRNHPTVNKYAVTPHLLPLDFTHPINPTTVPSKNQETDMKQVTFERYFALGEVAKIALDYLEAIKNYRLALTIKKTHQLTLFQLCRCYLLAKLYDEARVLFDSEFLTHPEAVTPIKHQLLNIDIYIAQNDLSSAIKLLTQLNKENELTEKESLSIKQLLDSLS